MTVRSSRSSIGIGLIALASFGSSQACSRGAEHAMDNASPRSSPTAPPLDVVHGGEGAGDQDAEGFDLQKFTPLIVTDGLQRAAEALERGDPAGAARLVEQRLLGAKPSEETPRWQLLLARLEEQAGELDASARAYQSAASSDWPLRDYAELGAGRVMLAQGRASAAFEHLKRVGDEAALQNDLNPLLADAASALGDTELAITRMRRYLDQDPLPEGWIDVALRLARVLAARATAAPNSDAAHDDLTDALKWARRVETAAGSDGKQAEQLEAQVLKTMPTKLREESSTLSLDESLERLRALVDARKYGEAHLAAAELLTRLGRRQNASAACEIELLEARALGGERQWGKATELLTEAVDRCDDVDFRARALFLAGKSAFSDQRYTAAIRLFARVESEAPRHALADDARLYGALAYREIGVDARFTDLLSTMADDYPDGDMTPEGVFRLALRQLEKGDYGAAVQVLERALEIRDHQGGTPRSEEIGRERYFLARARVESGEVERGLSEYEQVISRYPLSYYMLQAFTRLYTADKSRALAAVEGARQRGASAPFIFDVPRSFDQPGFVRALELLKVGDGDAASRELQLLGLDRPDAAPSLLWGTALLYQRAGAIRASSHAARRLETQWLGRWPSGAWLDAWRVAYPKPYAHLVSEAAAKNGVEEALIYAVIREESAFDARAISPADAYGLMQLIEPTAKRYAKPLGIPASKRALLMPWVNIALGSLVLAKLSEQFPTNALLAIPSYNAGPGNPRKWLKELGSTDFDIWVELIPFRETRYYTKRVLASRAAYDYLYGAGSETALILPLNVN